MTDKTLVPDATKIAAKRAFLRTSTQALRASIPTYAITGLALSGADPVAVAWSVGAAVLSSFLAGAASYLSFLSAGIPGDYQLDANTEV